MYKPTISRTLSTKKGSVESLKWFCRWGCKPNVRQMRWTASFDRPVSAPIERTDHCVSSSGLVFRGLVHHLGYLLVLDRPRRPWTPLIVQARKPAFEKALAPLADRSSATASLGQPSAASRTISARRTNPCGRLRERAIDANCSRSDSVSSNGANGRPNVISLSFAKGAQEKRTSRRSLCIDISTT